MKRNAILFGLLILLLAPWMVQAQNPAMRVILMDHTGTHAVFVAQSGHLATSTGGGSGSGSGDAVNVFHQSTIRHISSATHVAGGLFITNQAGTPVTVTGTALDVNCTGCSAASAVVITHVQSVTHVALVAAFGQHLGVAQSGVWNMTAHQGGEWNIRHIGSSVHVAAIAQPVHVVGVSIINANFPLTCHSSMAFHTSARATTIAHANSGMRIYICGLLLLSQAADSVSIVEGQGVSCATGRRELIGHTTAALSLPATGGFSSIHPSPWIASQTAGNAVCLIKGNATAHVSGVITYRGSD